MTLPTVKLYAERRLAATEMRITGFWPSLPDRTILVKSHVAASHPNQKFLMLGSRVRWP